MKKLSCFISPATIIIAISLVIWWIMERNGFYKQNIFKKSFFKTPVTFQKDSSILLFQKNIARNQNFISSSALKTQSSDKLLSWKISEHLVNKWVTLQKQGYKFRIIVFAWKRRASLKRLLESLKNVDYYNFHVDLDFHMDGEAHPKVVELIDKFKWPFGKVMIVRHAKRIGLEKVLLTC